MVNRGNRFYSNLKRRAGTFTLSLAMVASCMYNGSLTVNAESTGTWKGDLTAAMDELDTALQAADNYAEAKQNLINAYEGLEPAAIVENLQVTAVGEDYILLQWDAADLENLVGYNVYWADKDLETTKFQLLGPDGRLAERMSGDLDENGLKNPAPDMTLAARDVAEDEVIEFKVDMSTFKNNYFKVAMVTDEGAITKTEAVKAPTAVEYKAILDKLGRGLTAVQKTNGVYLSWRLLWDELDGGYTETGLTGVDFNVYKGETLLATVTDSTNYLDTGTVSGLTEGMYKIVPVKDGVELTAEACNTYVVLTNDTSNADAAYLDIQLFLPESPGTYREYYGLSEDYVSGAISNLDSPIQYYSNDASVMDVDNDGEYEIILQWYPGNAKDVAQWGFTGNNLIDCYKLDGTLLWRVDLGRNIRAGAHNTQHLAYDFEGDGRGELILKTAPGTKTIRFKLDEEGKNVLDENGRPVVAEENYITLQEADVEAGVTNDSEFVMDHDEYREHLIDVFMDWGVWSKYPESTLEEAILPYWSGNIVELFAYNLEWGDQTFYTAGNGSAKDFSTMTADEIREFVPEYRAEGEAGYEAGVTDRLIIAAINEPPFVVGDVVRMTTDEINKILTVDLLKNLGNYDHAGEIDLASVDFDASLTGGYTREQAEIIADYYFNHYGYTNGRHNMNYFEGIIVTGPEYVTLFDGLTGKELDTQNYAVAREDDGMIWGDYGWRAGVEPGNRVDRHNATVAYLDGVTPSAILGRGYYARTAMEAWNVENGKLVLVGVIDSGALPMNNPFNPGGNAQDGVDPVNGKLAGQGQHYFAPADVNLDGRQEIVNGGAIVGYDMDSGKLYVYNSGGDYIGGDESKGWKKYYHGDMMHITDVDPDLPGLEVVICYEGGGGPWDWNVRTLMTNNSLFGVYNGSDVARITMGDMNTDVRGLEISTGYSADGTPISVTANNSNHSLKWSADMSTQFVEGTKGANAGIIGQGKTYLTAAGYTTNNDTKGNPSLTVDLFGDSREELIVPDSTWQKSLRIYMNTEVSTHKNYTPMQNLQYRAQEAGQQSAYNIPSYTDYYYASDTDWAYVTIPNRDKDQAPGTVTAVMTDNALFSAQATGLTLAGAAGAIVNEMNLLDTETKVDSYNAEAWENLDYVTANLRAKMRLFADDSTPFDYDVALVNKLTAVWDAVEGVKYMPLADVAAGDAIYENALVEVTENKALHSEASVRKLTAAMAAYVEVIETLDISTQLDTLQETIDFWLMGVDTDVEVVYSKFFDFDLGTSGYLAPGWISIGQAVNNPYLTSYDAEAGYGLLGARAGRNRGNSDPVLTDWAYDVIFAMDLPAGDYKATVFTGEMNGTAKDVSHSFYTDYEQGDDSDIPVGSSGTGTGNKLAGTTSVLTASKNSYIMTAYEFTLTGETQVVFEGNAYIQALVMEEYTPATVKQYDINLLKQLIDDIDAAELVEEEYTVSTWEALTTAYNDAAAAIEKGDALMMQEAKTLYDKLYGAWKGLVLRAGIISYNFDFGPREDSTYGTPQLEVNGQSKNYFDQEAVAGAERPAFQLAHGDQLYADNATDEGLHWGFDQVVPDGNTSDGAAYFRDWVYAADSGNIPYTFMADLPTGDYFIFVYTGVKSGAANTTKLIFNNEVISTTNTAAAEIDGKTVYIQQSNTGGQYPLASSMYYVRVEENKDALSTLPRLKMGTLSITVFDNSNTSARTGVLNGLEIFPIRLDGPVDTEKEAVTIEGVEVGSKTYDALPAAIIGDPAVMLEDGTPVTKAELVYAYRSTDKGGYNADTPPVNAGAYQLVISVAETDENYTGSSEAIPFTISQKPVTVKPQAVTITKGEAIPAFALEYEGLLGSDTLIPSETPTFTTNAADSNTAGDFTITWSNMAAITFSGGNGNYAVTKVATGTLRIEDSGTPDVDKSELSALISEAEAKIESDYTTDSWAVFAAALNNAKTMMNNADATQEQVNSAAAELKAAMDSLAAMSKIPVTGVKIEGASLVSLKVGGQTTLTAAISPAEASNKSVIWNVSNTGIAEIDANGVVTAKASGMITATVTTVDGSYTGTVILKVSP